jgi:hypothetical protein
LNVSGVNGPGSANVAVRPSDSPKVRDVCSALVLIFFLQYLSTLYKDIDQAEAKEKKKKNSEKEQMKEHEEFLKRIYDSPENQASS